MLLDSGLSVVFGFFRFADLLLISSIGQSPDPDFPIELDLLTFVFPEAGIPIRCSIGIRRSEPYQSGQLSCSILPNCFSRQRTNSMRLFCFMAD